jgi:hypothetical protein
LGSRIEENPRSEPTAFRIHLILTRIQAIINRIRDRARRKAALSDRKSAAAQARMKKIASLANDERVPKKRRKGNGGRFPTLRAITSVQLILPQMTCSELTTPTGPFIERLYVASDSPLYITVNPDHLCLEHDGTVFRRRGRTPTIADDRTEAAYSRPHLHH